MLSLLVFWKWLQLLITTKKQRLTLASSYQLGILPILLNVSLKDASKIPLCNIMPTVYVHCTEAKNKHPLQFQIAPTNRKKYTNEFWCKGFIHIVRTFLQSFNYKYFCLCCKHKLDWVISLSQEFSDHGPNCNTDHYSIGRVQFTDRLTTHLFTPAYA